MCTTLLYVGITTVKNLPCVHQSILGDIQLYNVQTQARDKGCLYHRQENLGRRQSLPHVGVSVDPTTAQWE